MFIGIAIPTLGYPEGAPEEACSSLRPKHDDNAHQDSASPFTITTNKSRVKAGQSLTVTISSPAGKKFKGFLIAARPTSGEGEHIGQFTAGDDSLATNCGNDGDTITHSNSDEKSRISFDWTPSEDFKGSVRFTGTVVKSYEEFWSDLESSTVIVQ